MVTTVSGKGLLEDGLPRFQWSLWTICRVYCCSSVTISLPNLGLYKIFEDKLVSYILPSLHHCLHDMILLQKAKQFRMQLQGLPAETHIQTVPICMLWSPWTLSHDVTTNTLWPHMHKRSFNTDVDRSASISKWLAFVTQSVLTLESVLAPKKRITQVYCTLPAVYASLIWLYVYPCEAYTTQHIHCSKSDVARYFVDHVVV